jgi:hypothetical protein
MKLNLGIHQKRGETFSWVFECELEVNVLEIVMV